MKLKNFQMATVMLQSLEKVLISGLSDSLPFDLKALHQLEKVKNISKKSTNFCKKKNIF